MKVAYCGVAGAYWLTVNIPVIWKPFVAIDGVMGLLFVCAYVALGQVDPDRGVRKDGVRNESA